MCVYVGEYSNHRLVFSRTPFQLLDLQSKCLQMSSENRTLYALKQHVVMAMHPEPVTPVSVLSHKSKRETLLIWRGIYQGLDARK